MTNRPDLTKAEILSVVGETKVKGTWIMFLCPNPAHADGSQHPKNPIDGASCMVSRSGKVLCKAGCDGAIIYRILRERLNGARGTVPQQPRQQKRPPRQPQASRSAPDPTRGPPTTEYEFRDADGQLKAVHGRWDFTSAAGEKDKTFRWRLEQGNYQQGLQGGTNAELPLYGAEQVAAADPQQVIVVCEGEKAADAVRAAGQLGVCGAGGAGQRDWGDALEVLRGRTVYLWPDNDAVGKDMMLALRQLLIPIAEKLVVLEPAVVPKGDADDYFAAGGTWAELIANVLTEPATDVIGVDHIRVRMPTPAGIIRFEFEGITKSGHSLSAELDVRNLAKMKAGRLLARVNVLSLSAQTQLIKALRDRFGTEDLEWPKLVSDAYDLMTDAFKSVTPAVQLADMPSAGEQTFAVQTIVPEYQPTIFFGDGESGKTMVALDVAMSIVFGMDWHGRPSRQGGVLFIDYEEGLISFRMKRMLDGHDMTESSMLPDLPFHYWDAGGMPLWDIKDGVRKFVRENNIALIIIDSGADACGGPPEVAEWVLQYFRALSFIGCTSITLCHTRGANGTTWEDKQAVTFRPFGSRFWHNRARRTWYIESGNTEEGLDEFDVSLTNRKVNDGKRPKTIYLHYAFPEGEEGPIVITEKGMRDAKGLDNVKPQAYRIEQAIFKLNGRAKVRAIAEAIGMTQPNVRKVLNRDVKTFRKEGDEWTLWEQGMEGAS